MMRPTILYRTRRGAVFVVTLSPCPLVTLSAARAADKLEYNRDVRPILAENCFACHGPDSAARKADLRLDRRDAAVKAEAIVPGKPDESELIDRIISDTIRDELMPPPKTHKKLTAAQKEMLKRWIAAGAEYQPHWSFIAPKRPQLPAVKNEAWVRNPIDRFILAELEKRGLAPAPEADRRTLARRLSLDLTGLPPTPAERRGVRQRHSRRTPTRSTSIGCWPRRTGASIAAATGSTPPATPTRTASTSTTTARSGRTATG